VSSSAKPDVSSATYIPLLLLVACLGACSTPPIAQTEPRQFIVTAPRTAFYRYGPSQNFGPDFMLLQNERVTVLTREIGFSRIRTAREQTGYVANDDIAPAPASDVSPSPDASPAPSPAMRTGASESRPESERENIAVPQEAEPPLPEELKPIPQFKP
jgi:uncharacterized protein YgiM (DUF1202 family)